MTRFRVVACCLLLGCGSPSETETTRVHVGPIIDGESSGPSDDGVVMLRAELEDTPEVLCSGSLVAPNLVLTARHCVSFLTPGVFNCTVRGELVDNPDGGGALGQHLPAQAIEVYGGPTPRTEPLAHGKQVVSTLAQAICVNDIAFVVLDTALDLPVVPLRLSGSARVGETGTLVGYGLVEKQSELDYRTQRRARKSGLEIAALGPDSLAEGVTTVPPRALILNGRSGCVGDSGGPLLAEPGGAVLGVYSLQQGESCTAPMVRHQLVHVPPFRALIAEAFAAAGAEPTPEPGTGAGGATDGVAGAAGAPEAPPPAPVVEEAVAATCSVIAAGANGTRAAFWSLVAALACAAWRRRR